VGHHITKPPTNKGQLSCCVVMDTVSRLVAGWAIDSPQTIGPEMRRGVAGRNDRSNCFRFGAQAAPHGGRRVDGGWATAVGVVTPLWSVALRDPLEPVIVGEQVGAEFACGREHESIG
jgi:hypothetical protein